MEKQTTRTKSKANTKRRQARHEKGSLLKVQMPDGQMFELPEEIAGQDDMLRKALHGAYPDAATATFDRNTAGLVKVIKRAGAKGGVPEPAKEFKSNGQVVGGLANYKQQRGRTRFTKDEREIIALWRAIFAAMEEEQTNA